MRNDKLKNHLTSIFFLVAVNMQTVSAEVNVEVEIENISDSSRLPVAISPGVWLLQTQPGQLFSPGMPDYEEGLEALAEDGLLTQLDGSLKLNSEIISSGTYQIPTEAETAREIQPGESYKFTFVASNTNANLNLVSAIGDYNDAFFAPDVQGIELFTPSGILKTGDITDQLFIWDTGTEINEAPGSGPNQYLSQQSPGDGFIGGVVTEFTTSTHALPLSDKIANISVTETGGEYTFNFENITASSNAISSILSSGVFFLQTPAFQLFDIGNSNSTIGLETLAEEGDPFELVATLSASSSVEQVTNSTGANFPGDSYSISLEPSLEFSHANFYAGLVNSNDAFLALGENGVALLEDSGALRPASDVEADVKRALKLYDLGTEKNEVPGAGPNQPLSGSFTGLKDPNNQVRLYSDRSNIFSEPIQNNLAELVVINDSGFDFIVSLSNLTSNDYEFEGLLASTLWYIHDGSFKLFDQNLPASNALKAAAEDANLSLLMDVLANSVNVSAFGMVNPSIIPPGENIVFDVPASIGSSTMNLFTHLAPSNDTFLGLGETGVELLNAQNDPRLDNQIASDIEQNFKVWDAGTERNQSGAAGPDQSGAGGQTQPGEGFGESNGSVELFNDPIWGSHQISNLVRVTISELALFKNGFEDL